MAITTLAMYLRVFVDEKERLVPHLAKVGVGRQTSSHHNYAIEQTTRKSITITHTHLYFSLSL